MKKLGVLFVGVIVLGVLVGCGNTKTLTCTQSTEEGLTGTVVTKFKNDELVSGEQKMKMTLTEDMEPYFEDFKEMLVSSIGSLGDYEGVDVKTNDNGKNEIEIVVTFDADKINDEARSELGFENSTSYDDAKKSLEDEGFVCE